ncbi:MAG: hypothetical protein IJM25_11200 [Eubacterium sp.]|nr:hypothetical protein [Eubacterium sp.]
MKKTGLLKKRVIAAVMAGAMTLGLAACGSEDSATTTADTTAETTAAADTEADTEEDTGSQTVTRNVTPMQMSVSKETGEMNITRPELEGTPMGEEGTWTIFIYLCGSDLESGNGAAVKDIIEMAQATQNEKVRFVVQTGGSNSWNYESIDPKKSQRFVVENGDITNVYESEDVSMGDPATLTDYLTWGVQTYPADNMGLILWNHGNGAIYGVCFDEQHDSDALTLREIDSALLTAQQYMTEKWEFIGFDACLMGNIEAANVLANYGKYMYGSEEVEPGAGWNYVEIGNYLAENPTASGADLGPIVCDSFLQGCKDAGDYEVCTLAVIDLSKLNDVITSFNTFAKDIYEQGENADHLSTMLRQIKGTENFGSNNDNEGYSNMLDMGGLVNACAEYSSNSDAVVSAINEAVLYKINGGNHPNACGLSMYFPLSVRGSEELKTFNDICVSPYYMSFIDRQDYSAAYYSNDENNQQAEQQQDYYRDEENGVCYFVKDGVQYCYQEASQTYLKYNAESEEWEQVDGGDLNAEQYEYTSSNQCAGDYSDAELYDSDGNWNYNSEYDYDSTTKSYRSKPTQTKHFDYADNYKKTGESKHIKFLKAPKMDKEGTFGFTLTKYSLDHTSDVYANVFQLMNENEILILGDTYDVDVDWEKGSFKDMFDGYWLSLPDGQNLSMLIVDKTPEYVIFTSPIKLNGEETNLRIRQNLEDGTIKIEGAWDGFAESGAASREYKKLKDGDKIIPMYKSISLDDKFNEYDYEGQEFTVSGELKLEYGLMDKGDFMYAFIIEDIYCDYYETDLVAFNVDEDGQVSFYEE